MTSHRGFRSISNWRYKIIKNYLHRTQTFQERAKNDEELKAWQAVEEWFRSILRNKYLSREGVFRLPAVKLEDLEQ